MRLYKLQFLLRLFLFLKANNRLKDFKIITTFTKLSQSKLLYKNFASINVKFSANVFTKLIDTPFYFFIIHLLLNIVALPALTIIIDETLPIIFGGKKTFT